MKFLNALLVTLFLFGSMASADELNPVTASQLVDMQKNLDALVVDVRTEGEWQATGVIAGSHKLQAFDRDGRFDPQQWVDQLQKLKAHPEQPVILVCRSGNRSGKVGKLLTEQLGMKNVYHLDNGLQAWPQSSYPLRPNCMTVACK